MTRKTTAFLPTVKQIKFGDEVFRLTERMEIRCSPHLRPIATRLNHLLGRKVPLECDPGLRLEIVIGNRPRGPEPRWRNDEAYKILVTRAGISLHGASERAVFYAVVTLEQLIRDPLNIPSVEIEDWPDLSIRAYHLDLKGAVPTLQYLKQFIQELGRLKINMLVIEYENTFPYAQHRDLCSAGAFSLQELSSLMRTAQDHYIEVIPMIQSHGHVEYVLSKPAYEHLAEPASLYSELCPCNPGSIELFASLVDEMIKVHKNSRYFHVGGDEAYSMGQCQKCREAVKEKGHLGLYVEHMNRVFDIVMAHKKVPIFWDDMLWMYGDFDAIKKLRPGVVACHWDYLTTAEKSRRFVWNRGWHTSKKWCSEDPSVFDDLRHWRNLDIKWIEEAESDTRRFAKNYWKGGRDNRLGQSFAMIDFLSDHGIEVLGASIARGGASNFAEFYPLFHRQSDNIRIWARVAKQKRILGVLNTGWSRTFSTAPPLEPMDMCWHLIVLGAQCYWDCREIAKQDFDELFNKVFLQTREDAYTFAVHALDVGAPLELARERLDGLVVDRKRQNIVSHMALALDFAQTIQRVEQRMRLVRHEGYLYKQSSYHPAWVERRMEDLRKSKLELVALSSRMKKVAANSLKSEDIEEMVDSHIRWRIEEINCLLKKFCSPECQ